MVKQLDFGLPQISPSASICSLKTIVVSSKQKSGKMTVAHPKKKNVCLLPPFGSRHSRSSCNLCLKDRQKRPQFFCRCFQVLKRGNSSHLKGAEGISRSMIFWLVVSTPLKNMLVKMGSSSPNRDEKKETTTQF